MSLPNPWVVSSSKDELGNALVNPSWNIESSGLSGFGHATFGHKSSGSGFGHGPVGIASPWSAFQELSVGFGHRPFGHCSFGHLWQLIAAEVV